MCLLSKSCLQTPPILDGDMPNAIRGGRGCSEPKGGKGDNSQFLKGGQGELAVLGHEYLISMYMYSLRGIYRGTVN